MIDLSVIASEAKQSRIFPREEFWIASSLSLLAIAVACNLVLATHLHPSLADEFIPQMMRAQGMPDAGRTHGPPAEEKQAAVTTGSAEHSRHSLRDGFNAYT